MLEQRVSMNEESVSNVMSYFTELKDQQRSQNSTSNQVFQHNLGYNQTQGHVINAASNYNQSGHLSFNQNVIN